LLNDLLNRARGFATTSLVCYANSDIILLQELLDAVHAVQLRFPRFLAVAHRQNVDVDHLLDLGPGRDLEPRNRIIPAGFPGDHTSIDVFVFSRDTYSQVPPLAIGRAWFDQWLIKEAHRLGVPVVALTPVAWAIHQNHAYAHIAGGYRTTVAGEEANRNLAIYGGKPHAYTLLDVTHELRIGGGLHRVRFRRKRFAVRQWIWKNFVLKTAPLRAKLGLRRSGT